MKKYLTILCSAVVLIVLGSSCRQHDYRTLVVKVPEMRNEACVKEISKKLGTTPGLKPSDVKFDIPKREITVTYDSLLTADKNIEFLIVKAGFEANGIPADKKAQAALPAECKR